MKFLRRIAGVVHADLVGEQVHRPLDDVGRLRSSGAAIGVDERRVRVDPGDLAVDVRDLVAAGQDPGIERGRDARADRRETAAEVGEGLDPDAGDLAVLRAGDLHLGDVVAAVGRALVVLATGLDPLDGAPADELRREHHEGHVGVAEDLGAERATDIGRDTADLVLGDPGHERGQQQPLDVRRLARHPDRVLLGAGVVQADVAADLHRVRDQPLVDESLADDDLGGVDRGVRPGLVADVPLEDDVVRGVLVELRRTRLDGLLGVDDRRQRLPLDVDRLERVDGLLGRLGDDRGDPFPRPLDAVGRERSRRVDVVLDAGGPAGRPGHRQRVVRDVRPDDDRHDAGHRLGRRDVDRADVGVRVRAAQDGQVGHPSHLDVVEIAALAGDEPWILDALDRGAENVGGHRGLLRRARLRG